MGYIYKITNTINGMSYIGQTIQKPQQRWRRHIREANIGNSLHLYKSMQKHGISNFTFEVIEECENTILDEREIYWISHYDTFNNGYNNTFGGCGNQQVDYSIIEKLWDDGYSVIDISSLASVPYSTIEPYLKEYDKNFKTKSAIFKSITMMKDVSAYTLKGVFVKSFVGLLKAEEETGIKVASITRCCRGMSRAAGGFQWRYGCNKNNISPVERTGKMGYPVAQCTKLGEVLKVYKSAREAEHETKISNTAISACCRGTRKSAGGFVWKRSDNYD